MSPAAKPATVHELDARAKDAADAAPLVGKVHHDSLASALVAALADLTVIEPKNQADMGSFKVRYADLASLVKLTRRPLANHGLVVLTPLCHLNDSPAVQVTIVHEGGESMTFGPFPFQHGRDAQATGSWVTYMRRYALVAALGMAAGDDDDGATAKPRQNEVEPHPLRAKCSELDDGGKVWAHFLAKAGISDSDADLLLTDDEGWRNWLSQGIAAHIAAGSVGDEPEATSDG